jgi:hypothetical protein
MSRAAEIKFHPAKEKLYGSSIQQPATVEK